MPNTHEDQLSGKPRMRRHDGDSVAILCGGETSAQNLHGQDSHDSAKHPVKSAAVDLGTQRQDVFGDCVLGVIDLALFFTHTQLSLQLFLESLLFFFYCLLLTKFLTCLVKLAICLRIHVLTNVVILEDKNTFCALDFQTSLAQRIVANTADIPAEAVVASEMFVRTSNAFERGAFTIA